jgi:amino acid transporter
VIGVVSWIYPWQEIVSGRVGTEVAFERALGSRLAAQAVLVAAVLSLLKVFNGNFVAASRMIFAIGRKGLVHGALGRVHPTFGTPSVAVMLLAILTAAASFLGDALLVPVTEVGSLAVGIGWLSACLACVLRARDGSLSRADVRLAAAGIAITILIVLMKIVPVVPGSFRRSEWIAFAAWSAIGLGFWAARRFRPGAV